MTGSNENQMKNFKNILNDSDKTGNLLKNSHLKTIAKTSKEIVDLFRKSDFVVDFTQKNDLNELEISLEKKKEILEKSDYKVKNILEDYVNIYHDSKGDSKADSKADSDADRYKNLLEIDLNDIYKKIPYNVGIKEEKLKSCVNLIVKDLKDIDKDKSLVDILKNILNDEDIKVSLKSINSKNIKNKYVSLILMLSQLSYIRDFGKTKSEFEKTKEIIKNIKILNNQILAQAYLNEALGLVKARQKNLDLLESDEILESFTPKIIYSKLETFKLDKYISQDNNNLSVDSNTCEINKFDILDNKGVKVDLYEDVSGKPLSKTIKSGECTDIFIKDKNGRFVKLGNIGINGSDGTLKTIIEEYSSMPTELKFPIKLNMSVSAIAGNGETVKHKVSISKKLTLELLKPDFSNEYEELNEITNHNEKLKKIYDTLYESVLRDEVCKYFDSHKNDSIKNGWKSLSYEKKRTFFIDTILHSSEGGHPDRLNGIGNIDTIKKSKILTLEKFKEAFKEDILKSFDGKKTTDLKEFILEKLGTEPWTMTNPTYAQGIIGHGIRGVITKDPAENDLIMAFNKFRLGIEDNSIKQASYESLYPDNSDLHGPKDITASIADTEALNETVALKLANDEFAKRYENSMKRSLTRVKLFLFRTKIINDSVKKKMKGSGGKLLTDEETSSAVNRRMLKKEMNMEGANKIKKEEVFDSMFETDLNNLVNNYLSDTNNLNSDSFKTEVTNLIENNPELSSFMKKNEISHIGSNLIERVEFEKDQRKYYKDLLDIISKYSSGEIKKNEYNEEIRKKLADFSKKQNRLPDLVKELNLDIDDIDFAEKLAEHKYKLEAIRLRTVNMRVNMLINAKPKKEPKGLFKKFVSGVQKDERGLTTAQHVQIDKLGGRNKFYRRIEKHPWWTAIGTSVLLAGTATLASCPIIGAGAGATILFMLNFFKKRGHYTKEHVKFENELLNMTPRERDEYMKEMEENAEKRPAFLRKFFPTKYDKYGKTMEYLEMTQSTQRYVNSIKRFSSTEKILKDNEKKVLEEYVLKGMATLHLQETEGRNFAYSDEGSKNKETSYNELYSAIIGGLRRLYPGKNPEEAYTKISGELDKKSRGITDYIEYESYKKKMRSMRNKLSLFAGFKSAAFYLLTALLVGQIKEGISNLFGTNKGLSTNVLKIDGLEQSIKDQIQSELGKTIDFGNLQGEELLKISKRLTDHNYVLDYKTGNIIQTMTMPGGLELDSVFGVNGEDLLDKVFAGDASKFELFKSKISSLQPGDKSSNLRTIMQDIYGTNKLATEKTHAFFDNFGASIMENGKHELISLTKNFPLTDAGVKKIANLMGNWYTGSGLLSQGDLAIITNPSEIKSLFEGFANGLYDLNNLPTGWSVKTANDALHCQHGGFGGSLKDYIFDMVNSSSETNVVGKFSKEVINKIKNLPRRSIFGSFGIPTMYNEVNEFKKVD